MHPMSNVTYPKQVYFSYIKSKKKEQAEYAAKQWLSEHSVTHGWYRALKFNAGYIVEAHDSGDGYPFADVLLSQASNNSVGASIFVPVEKGILAVEVRKNSLNTIMLADDDSSDLSICQPDFNHSMRHFSNRPEIFVVPVAATLALLFVLFGLLLANLVEPDETIKLIKSPGVSIGLQLDQQINIIDPDVHTIEYHEQHGWSWMND